MRLLENRGHRVTVAGNGQEALEALAKETSTGLHQALIALTPLAMNGDREKCLVGGMDRYLAQQPIRPQQLDEIPQQYLRRGSRRRSGRGYEFVARNGRCTEIDAASSLTVSGLYGETGWTNFLRNDSARRSTV